MRDTERQRHRQREKQAPRREPDAGLNTETPGSCPGPKAGAKLLSHPGIPGFPHFNKMFSRIIHTACMSLIPFCLGTTFWIYFYFFKEYLFERERERQRPRRREKQAPCWEPDVGLDPGSPGSRPGPKAGAKLLSHPGIPCIRFLFKSSGCSLSTGILKSYLGVPNVQPKLRISVLETPSPSNIFNILFFLLTV